MQPNPYAAPLGTRDPLEALSDTPFRIQRHVERWGDSHFERSYAPDKWSARLLLVHLAQCELAFSTRIRYALAGNGYVAQPFDQEDWMRPETGTEARVALDAYVALRRFNLAAWRAFTPEQLAHGFRHPEYGEVDVAWALAQVAGHELHHLAQLERVK